MSLASSHRAPGANCFLLFGHTHRKAVTAALLHRMASLPKFSKVLSPLILRILAGVKSSLDASFLLFGSAG